MTLRSDYMEMGPRTSPVLGRWLSRDPIGEKGGQNLQGFVNNNPVNKIDLYGLRTYYIGGAMEHRLTYDKDLGDEKQIEVFADQVGADAYYPHNAVSEAISDINSYLKNHPNENIVLIGHSWGGKSAMTIAEQLAENNSCACITIITLDPVSLGGGPNKLPSNVQEWKNVHVPESFADSIVDVPIVSLIVQIPWGIAGLATQNGNIIGTVGNQWNAQDLATSNYTGSFGHMEISRMMSINLELESSKPFTLKDYAKQVSRGICEK